MTPGKILNSDLDVSDFHRTKAKDGMFFHKSDERYLGRKPTTVRVVTLGPGQPVFRFANLTKDDNKWDSPWWTSKVGFARILERVGPPEYRVISTVSSKARDYSAVKREWSPLDEIGWMVVLPGHSVKCFMGFGLPMMEQDGLAYGSNIQLYIPNLSINRISLRENFFTPVRSVKAQEFRPYMLNDLSKDGAEIWLGFKRVMPAEIITV